MTYGQKDKASKFMLSGEFVGDVSNIMLSYFDSTDTHVIDTITIDNGSFSTSGEINGAVQAWIYGKTYSFKIQDIRWFLALGNIYH